MQFSCQEQEKNSVRRLLAGVIAFAGPWINRKANGPDSTQTMSARTLNCPALKGLLPLAVASVALVLAPQAFGQASGDNTPGWSHSLVIYLLGPTLDGTVGIGPADSDVKLDAGDVFSALDGAFLGMYAGEGERWGVVADVVYMDLKEDLLGSAEILSGQFGNRQTTAVLSASYRVSDTTRLLAGALYTEVSADLTINGPINTRRASTSESWVDPVVGILYSTPLSDRWSFSGLAQAGGFGVSSDLVLSLTASAAYQLSGRTSLSLGYRYLDFDYEDGSGIGRFKFDMKQHGPAVGFRFSF
jgi:hypothetical protein